MRFERQMGRRVRNVKPVWLLTDRQISEELMRYADWLASGPIGSNVAARKRMYDILLLASLRFSELPEPERGGVPAFARLQSEAAEATQQ